jgi:hypothetical protein
MARLGPLESTSRIDRRCEFGDHKAIPKIRPLSGALIPSSQGCPTICQPGSGQHSPCYTPGRREHLNFQLKFQPGDYFFMVPSDKVVTENITQFLSQ